MTVTEDWVASRAFSSAPITPPARLVRAAVFGLGRSGLQHAALLCTLAPLELVGVGDPRRDARRNARGMGLAARAFVSSETMLRRATPEAVWIAAPYASRQPLAGEALAAGAAVVLEGAPILPAASLQSLLENAERAARPIGASLPLAYHPVFEAACQVAETGSLGTVREVRASRTVSRVFHPQQQRAAVEAGAERGALAHLGAELIFVLARMFGPARDARAEFLRVYGAFEDEARGEWRLESGGRLEFEVSWSTPGFPRPATVIEVEAEGGRMLVSEDALELDLSNPRGGFPAGTTRLGRGDLPWSARFDLDGDGRWLEDSALACWIAGGAEPVTSLARVRPAAAIVDALYASAADGGRRIEIIR